MNQDFEARTVMALPSGETLTVRLPGAEPFTVPLIKAQTVVGRAADSDLVLDDPSVSRRHALIERQGQSLVIRDLGSSNGLTLDGRRVESLELTLGRVVRLGQVELVLASAAPLETPTAAPGQATVVQTGAAAAARGSVPAAKAGQAGKSRRLLVVAGAAGSAVILLVILISAMGGKKSEPVPTPSAAPPASVAAPVTPAPPAAPIVQPASAAPASQAPAASATSTPAASTSTAVQSPPAAAAAPAQAAAQQAAGLQQSGQTYYEAGRLLDAAQEWRQALALDPGNQAVQLKLERVEKEINQRAEEAFRLGLTSFKYLDYEKAVQEWMQVLNLVPDPKDPLHQKTAEYIAQARAKLGR